MSAIPAGKASNSAPTGLLAAGTRLAQQRAVERLKDFAAQESADSPLAALFNPALLAWAEAQITAGKSADVWTMLAQARQDVQSARKAHALNQQALEDYEDRVPKLLDERDALRQQIETLTAASPAPTLPAVVVPPPAAVWRDVIVIEHQNTTYLLEEVDTGVTSALGDGAWDGHLQLVCYSPIQNNQAFREALELLLHDGFAGRVIGSYRALCKLLSLSIKRRLSAQERADYGEDIHALVKVTYRTVRDFPRGGVALIGGVHTTVGAS